MRNLPLIATVVLAVSSGEVAADERHDEQMRQIEWELDHQPMPKEWDGTRFADDSNPDRVTWAMKACPQSLFKYGLYWKNLPADVKASPRARAIQARVDKLQPVCEAMARAGAAFTEQVQARAKAAAAAKEVEQAQQKRRSAFRTEIQEYWTTVRELIRHWDPALLDDQASTRDDAEVYKRQKADLAAIHAVCQRYPGLVDSAHDYHKSNPAAHPTAVCGMAAAGGDVMRKKVLLGMSLDAANLTSRQIVRDAAPVIAGTEKQVPDWMQQLVFDRAAWFTTMTKGFVERFKQIGEPIPDDLFKDADEVALKLKARFEDNARADRFEMPPYRDAQVEALVKARVPKELKGAQVLKIGTSYKTWQAFDEKTWVKSDAKYDYYRVNKGKNRYKRGWILVKLANQPHCQSREFIVHRVLQGKPDVDSLDGGGYYVRCD
ncbi:MAG: hypothetical protein JNL83_24880 [Myxococcales bacterium]|nr:hypothetical protein [Myxococcales bacterium]